MREIRAVIAGGGIGGLTAAIGLAQSGHQVQVLEQAPEIKPVGAGISLQPNALQALEELGLAKPVAECGFESGTARALLSDGREAHSFDFSDFGARYGHLPITVFRGDLVDVLLENAQSLGVTVHTDCQAVSFVDGEDNVTVTTSRGSAQSADLLIGADGINSTVSRQLWGDRDRRYSGYVCWRGIVTDPNVISKVPQMTKIWGRGRRFGYMQCAQNKVYWFATMSCATPDNPPVDWHHEFRSWPDPVADLVDGTSKSHIVYNAIADRLPLRKWSSGRVTLLGDAAHAMTPNFGQGGAQAIDDAVVLTRSLEAAADLLPALDAYEQLRIPRTTKLVNESFQFGAIAQGASW